MCPQSSHSQPLLSFLNFLCKGCFHSRECPSLPSPPDSFLPPSRRTQEGRLSGTAIPKRPHPGPSYQEPQLCQWLHPHLPLHQTCAAPKQGLRLGPSGPALGWLQEVLWGSEKLPLESWREAVASHSGSGSEVPAHSGENSKRQQGSLALFKL